MHGEGTLDVYFSSALYILTADLRVWNLAQNYVSETGIEIPQMLEDCDFSGGYVRLLKLASHLFNEEMKIDNILPFEGLDEQNWNVMHSALDLRHYRWHLSDFA